MRRWITGRNLGRSQRDEMAPLVWIAAHLGAILAAHVPFQFMDRRCLRSPHDVQGNGLVRVAAKAFHFEIAKLALIASPAFLVIIPAACFEMATSANVDRRGQGT
jgi:hypothetical protein